MKTAAVILNYNDAKGTVDAVKRIDGFSCLDRIVVVDNASTDDSIAVIEKELTIGEKVLFVKAERNGGYGYGNNLGVKTAAECCGAELALIANPDAVFEEALVLEMQSVFAEHSNAFAVGAIMHNGTDNKVSYEEYLNSGWKKRSVFGCVLNSGPICRRLFQKQINYSFAHYKNGTQKTVPVYAVHGSLLMVDVKRFLETGGYDENMFLYGEESVLAEKCQKAGKDTYLLRRTYQHEGSVSITGSGLGAVRRQKLRNVSENYYYRNYLGGSSICLAMAKLFQNVVLFETCIAAKLHLL